MFRATLSVLSGLKYVICCTENLSDMGACKRRQVIGVDDSDDLMAGVASSPCGAIRLEHRDSDGNRQSECS
jgi:hypothetical protein